MSENKKDQQKDNKSTPHRDSPAASKAKPSDSKKKEEDRKKEKSGPVSAKR